MLTIASMTGNDIVLASSEQVISDAGMAELEQLEWAEALSSERKRQLADVLVELKASSFNEELTPFSLDGSELLNDATEALPSETKQPVRKQANRKAQFQAAG